MGSAISSVTSFANDADKERRALDALNSLLALAKDRQETFEERIRAPDYDSKSIPINKIVYEYQYVQVGVSADPTAISNAIQGALKDFVAEDITGGITKIVSSSLDILFGNYAANQSSTSTYAITTGDLGGVARIDADFFSYQFTSKKISEITKNVVVASLVISSANLEGLKKNDVTVIVQMLYKDVDDETKRAILEKIWAAVQDDMDDDMNDGEGRDKVGVTNPKMMNRLDRLDSHIFDRLNNGVHQNHPGALLSFSDRNTR